LLSDIAANAEYLAAGKQAEFCTRLARA